MDVLFLKSIFRIYLWLKLSFEQKGVFKNLFLNTCFCWDSRHSSHEMDQKSKFIGTIAYEDSYLEFWFCHSRVFRLHAILHDAAGAVRAQNGEDHRLMLHDWTRTKFMLARSRDCSTPLSLRFSALQIQLCQLLKQFAWHCTRYCADR